MFVVNAGGAPRRSERQLRDATRHLDGILILNALLDGPGGRTREVDGVLLTPTGVLTVEVKGTQLIGAVGTDANRAWTIGGKPADFYGSNNPLRQARTAAQALAGALRTANLDAGFVTPVLAISGNQLTLTHHSLGDTWVVLVGDISAAIDSTRTRPLSVATATAICKVLGVDVTAANAAGQGFVTPGTRAARLSRNQQLRTTATQALERTLAPLPGYLLVPGDRKTTGPDLSAVLLTPGGIYAVKCKATTLRGALDTSTSPWTIGGTAAHFGQDRPESQARSMAAWLTKELASIGVSTKVTGVITLAGGIETTPHQSQGAWVTHVDDLAGVLLRTRHTVTLEEATVVCAHFEHPVAPEALRADGFPTAAPATAPRTARAPEGGRANHGSRRSHQDARLEHIHTLVEQDWRSQNIRRTVGSLIAAAVLVGAHDELPMSAYVGGMLLTTVVALGQLLLRRLFAGPRARGARAVASWLLTLAPVAGLATLLNAAPRTAHLHPGPERMSPFYSAACWASSSGR